MDLNMYQESLNFFCSQLSDEKSEILDLACGPGNITQYLLHLRPQWSILGTDIAPKMLELARKINPTAQFEILDIKEIQALKAIYSGILCGFGLPYLNKEQAIQLIFDAYEKLIPGGLLYISAVEDDYDNSEWIRASTGEGPELFMHYHEAGYLTEAFKKAGFEILWLDHPNIDHKEKKKTELVIIGKK